MKSVTPSPAPSRAGGRPLATIQERGALHAHPTRQEAPLSRFGQGQGFPLALRQRGGRRGFYRPLRRSAPRAAPLRKPASVFSRRKLGHVFTPAIIRRPIFLIDFPPRRLCLSPKKFTCHRDTLRFPISIFPGSLVVTLNNCARIHIVLQFRIGQAAKAGNMNPVRGGFVRTVRHLLTPSGGAAALGGFPSIHSCDRGVEVPVGAKNRQHLVTEVTVLRQLLRLRERKLIAAPILSPTYASAPVRLLGKLILIIAASALA